MLRAVRAAGDVPTALTHRETQCQLIDTTAKLSSDTGLGT